MKKKFVVLAMFFALASVAVANDTIFSDNFDSENGCVGVWNYTGFANWTVSDGTVDLRNGQIGHFPDHGMYVDMDGSTQPGDAGKLTSKTAFDLEPGTYTLSFDLAGSQVDYSTIDYVTVGVAMGTLLDETTYTLGRYEPFTTFTQTFTVTAPTLTTLSFEGLGGDCHSMLLDNVSLESVSHTPAPGAFLLGGIGVGLVNWLRRRRIL